MTYVTSTLTQLSTQPTVTIKARGKRITQAVEDAKQNIETVNYLVGKVMKKTKGKANPSVTLEIIKKKLK